MTEIVVALILTLNGSVIEHVYKPKMSDCLKSKRIAEREVNPNRVVFSCKKINAKTINGRNAFILNYKKTIEFLIAEGYNVVRIGDFKSFSLPFINGFIDLTQKKYSKDIDIKLLSKSDYWKILYL